VGRSFYGNLAAESLSKWLVNELWQRRTATPDHDSMERLLKQEEATFSKTVEDHRISADLPVTLINTLERKRQKGSQTVFAGFVLEIAYSKVTLYQVGDIKALIHNSKPHPELVEAAAAGRWSSGGQSLLRLKRTFFENVDGLVIKSDGVSDDWGCTLDESALNSEQFNLMTDMRSPLDDVSFIAVRCLQASTSLLPAPTPSELLSESSSETESEATLPEPAPADSHVVPATNGEIEQKEVQPACRQRNVKIFMSGAASGAVLGVALTCLALFATGRLKKASVEGKQVAQQSNLKPASEKQSVAALDGGKITVEVKETEQKKFLNEHTSSLPPLISGNPTTVRDEVIAHVSIKNISVERIEFAVDNKEKVATERAHDGDQTSFFVRLSGLAKSQTVTIRLIDSQGNVIGEFHEQMRGREKSGAANKDPFLGYHEISVTRAQ
jgi:hypothetical protein